MSKNSPPVRNVKSANEHQAELLKQAAQKPRKTARFTKDELDIKRAYRIKHPKTIPPEKPQLGRRIPIVMPSPRGTASVRGDKMEFELPFIKPTGPDLTKPLPLPQGHSPIEPEYPVCSSDVNYLGERFAPPAETTREQLVMSRRGQGLFRLRVERIEPCCRITGVANSNHLIASHIKPWRDCDDIEKLDGNNGLMLSPHVDHLFDDGYISFSDDGQLLISSVLDEAVLVAWAISPRNVGSFSVKQQRYLAYHRANIFKK